MRLVQFSATLKLTLGHLCPRARVPGEDNSEWLPSFLPCDSQPVCPCRVSLSLQLSSLCRMQPPKRSTDTNTSLHSSIAICPACPGQGSMVSPIGCMTFSFALHVYICTANFPAPLPLFVICGPALCCLFGRGKCNAWRVQHPEGNESCPGTAHGKASKESSLDDIQKGRDIKRK